MGLSPPPGSNEVPLSLPVGMIIEETSGGSELPFPPSSNKEPPSSLSPLWAQVENLDSTSSWKS